MVSGRISKAVTQISLVDQIRRQLGKQITQHRKVWERVVRGGDANVTGG